MPKRRIGVNLLCYNDGNLAGTWFFFKRLFEAIPATTAFEFILFCQKQFSLERHLEIKPGIQHIRVNSSLCSSRPQRVLYEQLILPIRAYRLDVLFSPCVANPVFHPGCRTITTIHDLTPFIVPKKYGTLQRAYVMAMTRLLAVTSDRIITVSENSKADIRRVLGSPEDKLQLVYNFVPHRVVENIGYENYFLFVGTLQPAKNLAGVIKAFSLFSKQYDTEGHRLIIVGANGWGDEGYEAMIREFGMEAHVECAGYVSDTQLQDLYARCKGLILLSLYEGFGIPPLEALSWNKPSIVSNCSSLPEVVGRTGIKVDPFDTESVARAIKAIADDPSRYLCGRDEQLTKFSGDAQVTRFMEALESQ